MSHKILIPLFAGLMLSGSFANAKALMIKDVEVQVDLTAVTNPAAAARYANISTDLQSALAARLTERTAEDGAMIIIDVSEVELSNSFQESMGLADTKLVGIVKITDKVDNKQLETYELTVNVNQARGFFPAGTDVATQTASSDAYYHAMIEAFADAILTRLNQ